MLRESSRLAGLAAARADDTPLTEYTLLDAVYGPALAYTPSPDLVLPMEYRHEHLSSLSRHVVPQLKAMLGLGAPRDDVQVGYDPTAPHDQAGASDDFMFEDDEAGGFGGGGDELFFGADGGGGGSGVEAASGTGFPPSYLDPSLVRLPMGSMNTFFGDPAPMVHKELRIAIVETVSKVG